MPRHRRYNPLFALIGLIAMLGGIVIIVTMFALQPETDFRSRTIIVAFAIAFAGWLMQRMFGKRRSRRRE